MHGGPGFRDYLKPYFEILSNTFECIFYDQVQGPDVKIEDMLAQLDSIVSSASGQVALLGHSWGAILALEYAAKNPSKIAGLALMCTAITEHQWFNEYHQELKNLGLDNAGPEQIFLTPNEAELGVPFLDKSWETFSDETFQSICSSYLDDFDVSPKLQSLKIPIINIFGTKDVRFPLRVTKSFSTYNNNITDFEIKDAGHFPFLSNSGNNQIIKILEINLKSALEKVKISHS